MQRYDDLKKHFKCYKERTEEGTHDGKSLDNHPR
jgi:hypothetical protein